MISKSPHLASHMISHSKSDGIQDILRLRLQASSPVGSTKKLGT